MSLTNNKNVKYLPKLQHRQSGTLENKLQLEKREFSNKIKILIKS